MLGVMYEHRCDVCTHDIRHYTIYNITKHIVDFHFSLFPCLHLCPEGGGRRWGVGTIYFYVSHAPTPSPHPGAFDDLMVVWWCW